MSLKYSVFLPQGFGQELVGIEKPVEAYEALTRVAQAADRYGYQAGVRHIVKFSGAEASIGFDPERFRTTQSHEKIERYLEASGLAWTHLRPSQFMQFYFPGAPAMNLTAHALALPMGNAQLSPVDIEDIAKIAFKLLHDGGHERKSYDITGPEALTMTEIAAQISQATDRNISYVNITLGEYRRELLAMGTPAERVDAFAELWSLRRACGESRVDLRTHETFGVQPTIFAEFVSRNAAVFRKI